MPNNKVPKLGKRKYLVAEIGPAVEDPTWRRWSNERVNRQRVVFMLGVKHKRGSNYPAGTIHGLGWYGARVTCYWSQKDATGDYYGLTVEDFDIGSTTARDVMSRLMKALDKHGCPFDTSPTELVERAGALVVEPLPPSGDSSVGFVHNEFTVVYDPKDKDTPLLALAKAAR